MVNWLASMEQTFEFYIVDPDTWGDIELLTTVKSCTINRDSGAETLGSATLTITESVGECYLRVYLVTIQNGVKERHPLGTFLVQTPSSNYTGKLREVSMDAYTPLLELKENPPPVGYTISAGTKKDGNGELIRDTNIMAIASKLAAENMRAPVVPVRASLNSDGSEDNSKVNEKLHTDFISTTDDTWLSFITDLIANADHIFDLDEMGRVLFAPKQEPASLQPVWTFTDDDNSILHPDVSMDHDLFGIPNVVEVICSTNLGTESAIAVNEDPNSPVSTVRRGRKITKRIVDPDLNNGAFAIKPQVEEYAKRLLKELSSIEYTVTITHGYCPVRIGDCIRLDYKRAGLTNIKAKVISQSIKCEPGCPVTSKAVYTAELWG